MSPKPKAGRPTRTGEVADERIELRVTSDELAAIDKAAPLHHASELS